jgi:hypothetical protein
MRVAERSIRAKVVAAAAIAVATSIAAAAVAAGIIRISKKCASSGRRGDVSTAPIASFDTKR